MLFLTVDCGGSFIKSGVVDAAGTMVGAELQLPTPYPLSVEKFVRTLADIAKKFPAVDRVSVGMPGMIRRGIVVHTPHYINEAGPFTQRSEELKAEWTHCDIERRLEQELATPVKVVNDAELHGAGVINGTGFEVVFTLGTGLGSAMFSAGVLAPHLELSHASVRKGVWNDHWIGDAALGEIGVQKWNSRILELVESWRPVMLWDRLYIGGGNAQHLSAATVRKLGDTVTIVSNSVALFGGKRLWDLDDRRSVQTTN